MASFPTSIAAVANGVKMRFQALSRPAKILLGTTLLLTTVFAAFLLYREAHEPYAVLFTQLEQDDTAGIVAKLKELKAPYRIGAGGTTVEVPESKVAEIRMELAGAGLPRGGGVGFESFDKMRLGATEFEQRVLYRRALEGELARTIAALGTVQSARVHLVLPEKSVFVARAEPASASIMLHLRAGRALGASEVQGIIHLVAAAVPGLTAERVALLTSEGVMLKKPRTATGGDTPDGSDGEALVEQRAVESQLEDRARAMLEKVVGAGHVDVRVTADLDPARVEHIEDHYDPSRTALRSEELTRERTSATPDDTVAGVPGAESNLPGPARAAVAAAPAAGPPSASALARAPLISAPSAQPRSAEQPFRESHTRNFEVDHVSEKRTVNAGALKRIGVAVILDGVVQVESGKRVASPRSRAELDRLALLVRSAVGANEARGDSVTVDSVPFEAVPELPVDAVAPPAAVAAPRLPRQALAAAGVAAVALLGMGIAAARARARRRRAEVTASVLPPVVLDAKLDEGASQDLRSRALMRAASDPATAALVLRSWLGTSEASGKP